MYQDLTYQKDIYRRHGKSETRKFRPSYNWHCDIRWISDGNVLNIAHC